MQAAEYLGNVLILCYNGNSTDFCGCRKERRYFMEDNRDMIGEAVDTPASEECCCSGKTKERDQKEYRDLINRLSRVEGQIRGIKRMVENDAYCIDILVQVAAANAALNSFNRVLLSNHIKTCVTQDIIAGKEETVDELLATLQKLMK